MNIAPADHFLGDLRERLHLTSAQSIIYRHGLGPHVRPALVLERQVGHVEPFHICNRSPFHHRRSRGGHGIARFRGEMDNGDRQ